MGQEQTELLVFTPGKESFCSGMALEIPAHADF